jgi:hypothetical protein
VTLGVHLTPRERGEALELQQLFEQHRYWVAVYSRWVEDAGFAATSQVFFARFTFPLRQIMPIMARRAMRQELHGHGLGRHSREQSHAPGSRDVAAIADVLGEREFLLSGQPSTIDAKGDAFLANLPWVPAESPARDEARRRGHLEAYYQRIKARYYA